MNSTRTNLSHTCRRGAALLLATGLLLTTQATAQTWTRDVNEPGLNANAITTDAAGRTAVIYSTDDRGGVILFDAAGNKLTSYDLTPFSGVPLAVRDGKFLADGSLAICGSLENRAWVGAINPDTGIPLWNKVVTTGAQLSYLQKMTINNLGHVVCEGPISSAPHVVQDQLVIAVKPASNGTVAYRRQFPYEEIHSIKSTANGNLLFASKNGDLRLHRTTNWGAPIWSKKYQSAHMVDSPQISETSDGSLITVGLIRQAQSEYRFCAIKTNADGDLIWRKQYDSYPSTQWGYIHLTDEIVPTADGGVIAVASQPMPGDGNRAAAILRISRDGDLLWLRPFGPTGVDNVGVDLVATPDGGVIALSRLDGGGFRLLRANSDGLAGTCSLTPMTTAPLPIAPATMALASFSYNNYSGLWHSETVTPISRNITVTDVCGQDCTISSNHYGTGTVGTGSFVPSLTLSDGVCLGYTPTLEVDHAVGGTIGLMFVSSASATIPILGGMLLLDPIGMINVPFVVDGALGAPGVGRASMPIGIDLMELSGATFYMQAIMLDDQAPEDISATNGVSVSFS